MITAEDATNGTKIGKLGTANVGVGTDYLVVKPYYSVACGF